MGTELRNRVIIYLSVIVVAFLFLLPTLFPSTFEGRSWISKPISLGLDLRGGVYLVYQVQSEEAVKSSLQTTSNSIRRDLREEKVAVPRGRVNEKNQIELTLLSQKSADKAKSYISEQYKSLQFIDEVPTGRQAKLVYGLSEQEVESIKRSAVDRAIETLRNRVDQFGVTEPIIQKVGTRRIILQMPGQDDIEAVKKIVGSVAKLEFRFKPNSQTRRYQIMVEDKTTGAPVPVEDEVQMTGDAVKDASVGVIDGQVEVGLTLNSEGARTFRRITTEGVGRQLAIILDGAEYSAPRINEPIAGGRASITGDFTMDEARQLAVVLRAGALPAPLKVLEERTIGPTLGQESIERGVTAIIVGFILVVIFMIIYYKKAGIVAVASLFLNIILVVAALSAFGATLTLPGLAGLALTIGMAVDANVIIFERIREELRIGAGRDAAVNSGFDKALSAIIDSNITTLLAGLILYYFGTGPIKGFAVTLSIGILTTIYCATFVARFSFDLFPLMSKKGVSI